MLAYCVLMKSLDVYTEIYKEMEILLEEKQGVEARLEEAIAQAEDREVQLKRQMGEEQRLLINEAESKFHPIRSVVFHLP